MLFGGGVPPTLADAQAAGLASSAPSPNGHTSVLRRLVARGTGGARRHN